MTNQPDDLITADEAAVIAERTKASIRGWVRKNLLQGFRQDPKKSNSPLMISKAELLLFLAENNKQKKVGRPTIQEQKQKKEQVDNQEQQHKRDALLEQQVQSSSLIAILQAKIQTLEAEKTLLREMLEQQQQNVEQGKRIENHLLETKNMVERELEYQRVLTSQANEKAEKLQLKLQQLMMYLTLPWWKKLSSPAPMLVDYQNPPASLATPKSS